MSSNYAISPNSTDRISISNLLNPQTVDNSRNYLETELTTNLPPSNTNPIAANFRWDITPPPPSALIEMPPQYFPFGSYSQASPSVSNGFFTHRQTAQTTTPIPSTNPINPESNMLRETFELLKQVFDNIPENGDSKTLQAIHDLKQIIKKVTYIELIDVGNLSLQSILNFFNVSKRFASQAYVKLSEQHLTSAQIHRINNIQFTLNILNLLSSNKSISYEAQLNFVLLQNVFLQSILEAKATLQDLKAAQEISPEVQFYQQKEAAANLNSLNPPAI